MSEQGHSAEKDVWLAGVRRQAEYEIERFPNDDWPPIILALLTILDDTPRRSARYDHEARVWRDAETGEVVPSGPDAAWIAGGSDA